MFEEEIQKIKESDNVTYYANKMEHRDANIMKYFTMIIGFIALGISIILFIVDPRKYFEILLFLDVIGAILIVYSSFLGEKEKKESTKENKEEEKEKSILNRDLDWQE